MQCFTTGYDDVMNTIECYSPSLATYCKHDQCTVRLHVPVRCGDRWVTVLKKIQKDDQVCVFACFTYMGVYRGDG